VIRVSRILVNIFVLGNAVGLSCFYIVKDFTLSREAKILFLKKAYIVNAWLFLAMFFLLATVIFILICQLRVKARYLNMEMTVYKNETRMLAITLVVFSVSYLMRWIWDEGYMG